MRVVAGVYGGRPLKSLTGHITRPTTDKVKGAIFNVIGPYFRGGRVLDLYAGSGALSIEAVSRGMSFAVLVERNYAAQEIIAANVAMTHEQEKFMLLKTTVASALSSKLEEPFDLIFLDPPYAHEQIIEDIETLQVRELLSNGTTIVCETDKMTKLPDNINSLKKTKEKAYGTTRITIYR